MRVSVLRRAAVGLFFSLPVAIALPTTLYAQGIITGTIDGTVTDPSGAVIPHAHIKATDNAKGTTFNTDAASDGAFRLNALPIGIYTVTVTSPNFTAAIATNVAVNAGNTTDLNKIQLSLGSSATQIEVNAASNALLETSDAQVTTTFSTQQVSSLPLNNGFDTITEVIPGVVSTHGDNFSNTNGDNFSVNGQSGRNNNFELDGQANNDNSVAGPQVFFGNQDAIAQIQVITNDYSAQYGRNAGAVVNYITKSGTDTFHGSAFELYQGDMLASLTNFEKNPLFGYCGPGQTPAADSCSSTVVPRYVENRYGGTIGGPVIKHKLFFFGSTYWDRVREGASPSESLPDLTPTPAGITALKAAFPNDPAVSALATIGPYGLSAGNPTPLGTPVLTQVTGPNGVTATIPFAGVTRSISSLFNDEEELGRLDWQPTDRDHMFLRYFYQNQLSTGVSGGSIAAGDFVNVPSTTHSVGADWTHTFNDHWVDQLRYSFQQSKVYFDGGAVPNCLPTSLTDCPTDIDFIGAGTNLGLGYNPAFPQGRTVKVTQIQNNATWTRGAHTILFGGEFDYQNSPNIFLPLYNGLLGYDDFNSFLQDSGIIEIASGNPVIPFTERDVAGYVQDDWKIAPTFTAHIGIRWEFFGQAVNELHNETVARESNPSTAFFDTSLPLSERTVPDVANIFTNFEPRLGFAWNPLFDKKLVVRGGYAINANPAFYNIFLLDAIATPVAITSVATCSSDCQNPNGDFSGGGVRAQNLSKLALGGDPRFDDQTYVPTNFRTPYVQTYNLGVEHQVGRAAVFSIRYTGAKTTDNFQSVDENPYLLPVASAFPGAVSPSTLCSNTSDPGYGRPNCDRANLAYVTNGGWANYNALDLNFTTQRYHGLTSTISYTFSREISNVTDVFASSSGAGSSSAFAQNPLNTDYGERGVDGNSFPNVVGLTFNYEFPKFNGGDHLLRSVINGFDLNGLYRYTSGQPFTATQPLTLDGYTGDSSFCDSAFNASSVGPDIDTCRLVLSNPKAPLNTVAYYNPYTGPLVAGANGPAPSLGQPTFVNYNSDSETTNSAGTVTAYNPGTPINPSSAHWIINNQAYAQLVGNPYPGSGRNILRGQQFNDLDVSIFKTTQLTERFALQLQMNVYNVTNYMFRGTPVLAVGNYAPSGFNTFLSNATQGSGVVPGDTAGNRIVIIGGKLLF